MKIALLTPMPPDREAPGAIPVVLHAQLAGLAERNEVTLITPAGPDPAELRAVERLAGEGFDVRAVPRHFPLEKRRWRRRRRLAATWLRGRWPWRTVWFWEPALQPLLDDLLATHGFDVVAVEDNAMGIYRLATAAPKIITEHEVRRPRALDVGAGRPSAWPRWAFREADWRRWPRYQREVWGGFDVIQVFTERDAASIAEIAPGLSPRVRVNPFGVELPELSDAVAEEPGAVLFVGNFTHPPNVDAALWLASEIMPRVRERVTGARLWLAGVHAPREVLALAGPDVKLLGYVPDLDAVLRRAAVVAAPVRTGGGMRMKLLHAMALGRAVVTTPRGLDGLMPSDGGPPVLVADDSEGLAEAVAGLLQSAEGRAGLGDRARGYVAEHHSGQSYARRLEAMYADATAEQGQLREGQVVG